MINCVDIEKILELIIDIYEEFKISKLGFDLFELCRKMEINLIPYSSYEDYSLLLKKDEDGFNLINPYNNKIEIYYNDMVSPHKRIKFTIPHEIGHIALGHNCCQGEETNFQKKEANIFANELYCPQAFIIFFKLKTVSDLISSFDITASYAEVLLDKIRQRPSLELKKSEKKLVEVFLNNQRYNR